MNETRIQVNTPLDRELLLQDYSKVSNKRTVFNNRTGGDIILQKV